MSEPAYTEHTLIALSITGRPILRAGSGGPKPEEATISHTTRISSCPIKDVLALRAAVQRLKDQGVNIELREKTRPRMYYRHQEVECDFVAYLPNAKFDVGFQKQADGSYLPIYDEHANIVGRELAVKAAACPVPKTEEERALAQLGMLSQEYARCAAVNMASSQGLVLESEARNERGEYVMEFAVS